MTYRSEMMLAENLSASFLKQLTPNKPYALELGYFRSKIFITDSFTNPLIAAASPLISLLERIHIAQELPNIEELQSDIHHEFQAFFSRLQQHAYSDEFYALANYLLAATTDELLGKSYLRLHGSIQTFSAFTPITQDGIGPEEHFFSIIAHLLHDPGPFLDLIELSYYCLLIGFEGKYHLEHNGRLILDNLTETLFQTIHKHRANKQHKLFKNYVLKTGQDTKKQSRQKILIITTLSIFCLILGSQFWIKYQTQKMLQASPSTMEYFS
jgi:type VI secretion system protein ImpK